MSGRILGVDGQPLNGRVRPSTVEDGIQYCGQLIDCIANAVKRFNVNPHSSITIRIGDDGVEMPIQHVKASGGVGGTRIILQAKKPD